MSSFYWPPSGSGSGVSTYANFAALPATAADGTLALTLDTDTLYVYNLGLASWLAIGAPGLALAIGTIDSQTASANGAVLHSSEIIMQSASATVPGLVNLTTQTMGSGTKIFANIIDSGLTASQLVVTDGSKQLASVARGNLTETTSAVLTIGNGSSSVVGSGVTITVAQATTSTSGYLSSTDWNTFNGKQASGNYITALTGDGTASGPGSAALTLATVNSNVGTFAAITLNAKGLATAGAALSGDATTSGAALTLATVNSNIGTFAATTINAKGLATAGANLSGDITTSGAVSTLATVNSNVGSFTYASLTVNAKGLVTAASSGSAPATSFGPFGSAPSANAGVLSAGVITLEPADATHPGGIALGAQTMGSGTKTFDNIIDSGLTASQAVVTDGSKQLASLAYATTATATTLAERDANANLSANSMIEGYNTTASSAGTLTLLVGSAEQQFITGSTTHTVLLPVTSTLVLGQTFEIINNSTGVVTVQSSGANTIRAMAASSKLVVTCILTSGTGIASWDAQYSLNGAVVTTVNPTVQKFTSSSSGTYTTPAGVQYIRVRMVGGGGGGSGSGTAGGTAAGDGGATTFGTTLLAANGGVKGVFNAAGGAGGSASLGSGPIGTALSGANGTGYSFNNSNFTTAGPAGPGTPFGGDGASGANTASVAGVTNTGAGGAGGWVAGTSTQTGSAGGAGGFVDAIITSPLSTYSYTVGAAGSAGGAGTAGNAGGAGGSGYIEVTEYYTALAVGTSVAVSANTILAGPTSGSAATPTFRSAVPQDIRFAVNAQAASYSLVATDSVVTFTGTRTATLPTAASISGTLYTIKNAGTGVITINTTSAQTVDGYASGVIKLAAPKDYITVVSDGSNWVIVDSCLTVAMYTSGSSTAFDSGGATLVPTSIVKDTYSIMNAGTGIATIPLDGYYSIGGRIATASSVSYIQLYYVRTGSVSATNQIAAALLNVAAIHLGTQGAALVYFTAGDTVLFQGRASASVTADDGIETFIYKAI